MNAGNLLVKMDVERGKNSQGASKSLIKELCTNVFKDLKTHNNEESNKEEDEMKIK